MDSGPRTRPSLLRDSLVLGLLAIGALSTPVTAQPSQRAREVRDSLQNLPAAQGREKTQKLRSSAFVFFRGTASLSWRDTSTDPRLQRFGGTPQTRVWVTGDLHPENFGTFGLPGGAVGYDLNDFDEALVADYQIDLWRMATGIELAGRELHVGRKKRAQAIERFARGYLAALSDCAGPGNQRELDPDRSERVLKSSLEDFRDDVAKDESRKRMLREWTRKVAGRRAFDLRLDSLGAATPTQILGVLRGLARYAGRGPLRRPGYYRAKSVARRLQAGTGSLGSARFYVLIEGPSRDDDDDLILDLKAQSAPAGLAHLDPQTRAGLAVQFPNQAARVAFAERALLGAPRADSHLGWLRIGSASYSVRQRSPFKGGFPLKKSHLRSAAEQWGGLLGYAHARADKDATPLLIPTSFEDEVLARTRYQKAGFARLLVKVADDQADAVEDDLQAFRALTQP